MPHAVLFLGAVAADTEGDARQLVPGIEPGGSRAGHPFKPAVLLQNAWIEVVNAAHGLGDVYFGARVFLKLSTEEDLSTGLLLPVAQFGDHSQTAGVGEATVAPLVINDLFQAQGTIWVPHVIGLRVDLQNAWDAVDVIVHLEYEAIEIPWVEWFRRWDFLDNVGNNEREY